jgi:hypothetical protein
MIEYDVLIIIALVLSMVSFLLYGRARAYGVSKSIARRTVIEIWAAAAIAFAALATAAHLVPAARMAPWGVLNADPRGRAIAIAAGLICVAAGFFASSRARALMNAGRPPELGVDRDDDSSEDVGS